MDEKRARVMLRNLEQVLDGSRMGSSSPGISARYVAMLSPATRSSWSKVAELTSGHHPIHQLYPSALRGSDHLC